MDVHRTEATSEPVVLPPCEACNHAADEHIGPDAKCRICGDRYQDSSEDDLPSNALLGE
jgi:uncharacterized protein (DUF983 family)